MKKVAALILTLCLVMFTASSLAAGKLSVEQENFYVINNYSNYGYAYARVKNVGNKPIKVNAGILEIFDENGDNITSSDYLNDYAQYLQPDEYTYVYMYTTLEDDQASAVDDYLLTITGKSDMDYVNYRLPCTDVSFQRDVQVSKYSTYDCMYATITNDTDEILYDIDLVFALLDDDDNILYMEGDYIGSNKGLMPNSSIQIRESVSSSFMEYYANNGLNPTHVDVIAFIEKAQ